MATQEITVRMDYERDLDKMARHTVNWSEAKKQKFSAEWKTLEAYGSQVADTEFRDGVLHCWISDDFKQLSRKFGVDF